MRNKQTHKKSNSNSRERNFIIEMVSATPTIVKGRNLQEVGDYEGLGIEGEGNIKTDPKEIEVNMRLSISISISIE